MRIEVNLQTGEQTEHEDAPVTWEVPTQVEQPKPTVEQLQAQLADIAAKLQALQGTTL
jgi:hypothetical protein